MRWQKVVSGDANAIAIAPPLGKAGGEVAIVGREGLARWSATGEKLGANPVAGWTRKLFAEDLDGNGQREWIVAGWQALKVLDHAGEAYWERQANAMYDVAAVRDINGDGNSEIVLQEDGRVIVLKSIPDPLWKSRQYQDLDAVVVSPRGTILVQADGKLTELDARGQTLSRDGAVPKGRTLSRRIENGGAHADLFKGRWDPDPIVDVDVDGDGEDDIVIAGDGGIIAYDRDGNTILRLRSHDVGFTTAVGNLDGKPGDELALFVDHYGLVVLGPKS